MIPIEDVVSIAQQAGKEIIMRFNSPTRIISEKDVVVTNADLIAHEVILNGLSMWGVPILSEENADRNLLKEKKFWIVDPLDGTKNFLEKSKDFSVMIALLENGQPILSVLHEPAQQLTLYAKQGEGAWIIHHSTKEKKRIKVSNIRTLKNSICLVSQHRFSLEMKKLTAEMECRILKRGSSGVKLGLVARGEGEFTFNPGGLCVWDVCAPALVLTEAGGCVSDVSGQPINYSLDLELKNGILATNTFLHAIILKTFSKTQYGS